MSVQRDILSSSHFEVADEPETLVSLLRQRALREIDGLAYTFLLDGEAEEERLSYGSLNQRARAIGAWLQSVGAAGGRALLLYPPGLDFIAAFFGCLYAGAVAVPAYPPRQNRNLLRLRAVVNDAQATVVLTTRQLLGRIHNTSEELPELKSLSWLTTDNIDPQLAEDWQEPNVCGGTLAMLQYTSGSTSLPKGVMVSHENLLHNQRMIQNVFQQSDDSLIVGWLPLHHDMGLIGNVLQPLYLGRPCVLMSPGAFLQRPLRWLQAISRYRATTSGGPNFAYDLCARKITRDEATTLDLSRWSVAFNGSEPIRGETLERFASTFEPSGFRAESFAPCYGLAEATLLVSGSRRAALPLVKKVQAKALERNCAVAAQETDDSVSPLAGSGSVAPGQRVIIVNPETLIQSKPEQVGEIWVSGPSVTKGYWNRPKETKKTFQAYLADTLEGPFLRTGDLGFLQDGELWVTGRIKDILIIRGRNLYPQDIEFTVQHSDARLRPGCGAAFSIEVNGEEKLIVIQELARRRQADVEVIIDAVRRNIAEEHEVQLHGLVLIKAGTLPKTSSGKIRRHACRAEFLAGNLEAISQWNESALPREVNQPAPAMASSSPCVEDLEAWLVETFAARLGIERSKVEIDRPLIQYGLDSLAAIQLMHSVEVGLGVRLPAGNFLQSPSITQLANQISRQLNDRKDEPIPLSAEAHETIAYPLSHGQQSLWLLNKIAPESAAYNVPAAFRLRGELKVDALRCAFESLVKRHAALRTSFSVFEGVLVQHVYPQRELSFRQLDASAWDEALLQTHLSDETHCPFDLEADVLLRITLYTRQPQEHVLLLVLHHIITDYWSLALLIHELGILYGAKVDGSECVLAPLKFQYTDYVRWQAKMLEGPEGERLWNYWQKQLAGSELTLELPTPKTRPPRRTYQGASQSIKLGITLSQQLRHLSREHETTPFVTLLAAFETLLYRYTGQEDIFVGVPVANRSTSWVSGLLGYFVNPVVLRAKFTEGQTFEALMAQVRQDVKAALDHQAFPFDLLVDRLQPERDANMSPLFQVMFVFRKSHLDAEKNLASLTACETGKRTDPDKLHFEPLALRQQTAQYDLTLVVDDSNNELTASFEYNTELFDEDSIKRMLGHLETLLAGIIANPQREVSALPLLTPHEELHFASERKQTRRDYPSDRCLHHLIEEQTARTPNALALSFQAEHLIYAELNCRANQLAHYLRSVGVCAEVRVGVLLQRNVEMVVALLGILKAGGAYVPLDPTYPQQRLSFMLEDCAADVLLTEQSLRGCLPGYQGRVICVDDEWPWIAQYGDENPESEVRPENLAYVIYTSGSTGTPKGVAIQHRSAANLLFWAREFFSPAQLSAVLASTSICFDLSIFEIFVPLYAGGTVMLVENALQLLTLPACRALTLINVVPSAMQELVRYHAIPESVQVVNLAGEALSRRLVEQVYVQQPGCAVYNLYGPSEDTTYSTAALVKRGEAAEPTIGRGIANTEIYLLDERMKAVPVGVSGEVYIGGGGLARGYLNRPELTAERFIPNPYSSRAGARLYRTGDVARYRADGEIEYVGRADEQVKVRGFRIELGEVEAVVLTHPAIARCVVLARADERGEKQLVAYLIAKPNAEMPSGGGMRKHMRERVPEYMMPSRFVVLEAMPLTPNGKVDRGALREIAGEQLEVSKMYEGPRGKTEEAVAEVWREVLGEERVGREANFFELGGHSLLATQAMGRLREVFAKDLPVRLIFERPTVAALAESIEGTSSIESQLPPIEVVSRVGELPLSFAQQRLWFLDKLQPGLAAYNIPVAFRLNGTLKLRALTEALSEIVRRHETLRTAFVTVEGRAAQVIAEAQSFALPIMTLPEAGQEDQEAEVLRVINEEAQRPFDLSGGGLFRVKLLQLSAEEHVLLLTMHHIISDGWSVGVLLRELAALYEAYSNNRPSPLPELPVQYADFANWQREWLKDEVLEGQLDYWRKQLDDAPQLLQLPTDRSRPSVQTYRGATQDFSLPKDLSEALKTLGRQEDATLFMTLLAAFQALLYRYTGQQDILVSTGVAHRPDAQTEALIGCFINVLVMRTVLSGEQNFRQLLERVRETTLEAYEHQDLPFEVLVEDLRPTRDLSFNPLTQVMLVLQNAPREAFELKGLKSVLVPVKRGVAQFDITVHAWDEAEGLRGFWEYNTDLFDALTITRMIGHFSTLLETICANPQQRIAELSVMTDVEQRHQLIEWNKTQTEYPDNQCLHHLFEAHVKRNPEAVAVIGQTEELTYGELDRRANQLARQLRALGVGAEVRVGLCVERSIEMVVGILGILKAGGAYVPLDPTYPHKRLSFMMKDSQTSVLVTQEHLVAGLPAHDAPVVCVSGVYGAFAGEENEVPANPVTPDNLAYVIYTSGSTGTPKGVAVNHRGVVNNVTDLNRRFKVGPADRVLALSSLSFDMCVYEVLGMLGAGGAVVIPNLPGARDPVHWAELIVRHRVSVWNSAPSLLEMLVDSVANRPELHPRSIRVALLGGDWVPVSLPARLTALTGDLEFISLGGATEASIHSIIFPVKESNPSWRSIPYGQPMSNQTAYLLDADLQPVPVGVAGELHLGGIGLARGYFNRPDLTAQRFIPNPFGQRPGERIYKTGDLARLQADGHLELLGRMDHQVKIRGFRVEFGEITAALRQHASVQDAVIVVREDDPGGERLVGYVVAAPEAEPDSVQLKSFLKETLPEYMVPSAFVVLDALPLSPHGKLDRGALPAPDAFRSELRKAFVAPRSALEEVLAEMWREVLGVEQVGVHDNFFELGGHSLLVTQIIARIYEAFSIDLSLRVLYEAPTVAELSACVEELASGEGVNVNKIAQIISRLNRLSDDEIKFMLAERGSPSVEAGEVQS